MSGTKRFALRCPPSRQSNLSGWLPLGAILLLAQTIPVQSRPLPLLPAEQEAVNEAIHRGTNYLRRTQLKTGTWAKIGIGHRIGYAVLPGLTLLECGVAPNDPLIQQAAQYLRTRSAKLDTTYELSLAILFLDRLGDPKDKQLIQTFALRLIAGQSATGGWGYRCPPLSTKAQQELLTVLRHLDPPPKDMPDIARKPGDLPFAVGKPPDMPDIARKPADMPGIAEGPGKDRNNLPLESRGSHADMPSLAEDLAGGGLSGSIVGHEIIPDPPCRWRDCLGLGLLDRQAPDPLESDDPEEHAGQSDPPAHPADHAKAEAPKPDKPFTIPERLRMLTVVQDPAQHIMRDPRGKRRDFFLMTTDNSNTQFATLALWAAQRYDVPMHRTLNLIVRRFVTSQNPDGSWNYHYRFGGGVQHESFSSAGAMTCVGLIGLAVGHGLNQPLPAGQPVQDPRVLKALTALYQMVGKPGDRLRKLPMQNLYYLWSLERVAVLYRLPTIGDKDWYRWGAQVLVGNQETEGTWSGGLYPGSSPTIDTCLALLFLKRANLAKDLTEKLPFKAADLNHDIMLTLTPAALPESPEPVKKLPSSPETAEPPLPSAEASERPTESKLLTKPLPSLTETATPEENSGKKKWVVIALLVFALFAGGGSILILLIAKRNKREDEEKNRTAKKRKNKRKMQSTR